MLNYEQLHTTRRPYARRLPAGLCRRVLLSFRVQDQARQALHALAFNRKMSPSEYLARLLNDHLAQVSQTTDVPLLTTRAQTH